MQGWKPIAGPQSEAPVRSWGLGPGNEVVATSATLVKVVPTTSGSGNVAS